MNVLLLYINYKIMGKIIYILYFILNIEKIYFIILNIEYCSIKDLC